MIPLGHTSHQVSKPPLRNHNTHQQSIDIHLDIFQLQFSSP
jgi:hypothetical protein